MTACMAGAMTQAQPAPPLAPCPFGCKGEISVPEVDTGYFRGHCHACGALGPTGYSREDAARLWNRRPAPATRAENAQVDLTDAQVEAAVRAGCERFGTYMREKCAYPECDCKKLPLAIRAALKAGRTA